jgi:hypothetical protein
MKLLHRISALWRRNEESRGLREEMELHLELRARKLHQAGFTPAEAGFAARRQFGNATVYQDQISALWG